MNEQLNSYYLLCPGPVNVRREVAEALSAYEFCHREEEFSILLEQIRARALAVAGLEGNPRYTAVVLTGSGSSGNEAVLSSVVAPDDTVLVLASGEFGQRLGQISSIYNRNTVVLRHEWAEPIDLERVANALREHRPALVAMVHHETSTGLLNPVAEVGALCKAHGARFFVDAVSSFSCDPLDIEDANITFLSTSSGKAIGTYPGLALVIGQRDAFEALTKLPERNYYLSLRRYYAFAENRLQTPYTPAVPLFLALNKALELCLEEGMPARFERQAALAAYVRKQLHARGLVLLSEDGRLSNAVTSVITPSGVDFESVRKGLRARGFVIYAGKGPLEGRIVQISTIGHVDFDIIDQFFAALDEILAERSAATLERSTALSA